MAKRLLTLGNADNSFDGIANRLVEVANWMVDRNERWFFPENNFVGLDLEDGTPAQLPGDSIIILGHRKPNQVAFEEDIHFLYQPYVDISFGDQPTRDYRHMFERSMGGGGLIYTPDVQIVLAVSASVAMVIANSRLQINVERLPLH